MIISIIIKKIDNKNNCNFIKSNKKKRIYIKMSHKTCKKIATRRRNTKTKSDFFLEINSEGIDIGLYEALPLEKKRKLKQCPYCHKVYNSDMLSFYKDFDITICHHCIFWLNYSIGTRKAVDDLETCPSIANYIIKCYKNHDINKCQKNPECFLCDFINGKEIDGIKNVELLINLKNGTKKENKISEKERKEYYSNLEIII